MNKFDFKPLIRRLLICVAISSIAVLALSEIAFRFQSDGVDRGPETIELVIPPGTAEMVAAGMAPPEIPDSMTFVIGDELVVVNQDEVDHQLGPVWVPPGGSGSLQLGEAQHIAFACSFQPTEYLGVRVAEPTTIFTRILALLIAVPPTAAMLLVYSLAAMPLDGGRLDEPATGSGPSADAKQRPYVKPAGGTSSLD